MKYIRAFALFVATVLFVSTASAQQFRVDPLFEESAMANLGTSQEGHPSRFEMSRDTAFRATTFTVIYLIGMLITGSLAAMLAIAMLMPLISTVVLIVVCYYLLMMFDFKTVRRRN